MMPVYYQMPYPVYHQVVSMDPSPSFRWCPRKMPLNWSLVEEVDVDEIIRTMDISALEYLVQHIAFANISDSDAKRFGNGGSLKAFKLLQLGVEYLTHLKRPLPVQPDSGELRKDLSQSQRRIEELENLLYDSQLEAKRHKATAKIYKNRLEALQRQISGFDDDDGEIHHIEGCDLDPMAPLRKEVEQMKVMLNKREKAIQKQSRAYGKPRGVPAPGTSASAQIEELFRKPTIPYKPPQVDTRMFD